MIKVSLPADYRSYFTLDDMTAVKHARQYVPSSVIVDAANLVAGRLFGKVVVINEASFTVVKNSEYDRLGDGTGNLDVWIDMLIKDMDGYMEVGITLSDVWKINDDNADDILAHKTFTRAYRQK